MELKTAQEIKNLLPFSHHATQFVKNT
ncbi:MAG: hypothetical protein K940chlam8_00881, partial [Chlamydiae bacterium]|nr:hypothetical protein [Chlamydiota bacterium]